MRECVTAVAGAVAHLPGDAQLEGAGLRARGKGVELAVEPVGLAAEDRRDLPPSVVVQVWAGVVDLLGGVEQGAVVDADGVGVLVFDDGAVHERAEVADRLVVQVAGGDPLGDRLGQLRGDLVHVGELVRHRHGDLLAGGPFRDAGANLLGQRELPAEVVRPLRGDAEVGADSGDPVAVAEAGSGVPAVVELLLLVCQRELLALLAVGLDAPDLLRGGGVVEQQHDQAADRLGEAFPGLATREAVAGVGGEVAPLAVVEDHGGLVRIGAPADAGHELAA